MQAFNKLPNSYKTSTSQNGRTTSIYYPSNRYGSPSLPRTTTSAELCPGGLGIPDTHDRRCEKGLNLVVDKHQTPKLSVICSEDPRNHSDNRCFQYRMGGSHGKPDSPRLLDYRGESLPDKHPGTNCHQTWDDVTPERHPQQMSSDKIRQYCGIVLHQEEGWHKMQDYDRIGNPNLGICQTTVHNSIHPTHPRETQPACRLSLQTATGSKRLEAKSCSMERNKLPQRPTTSRPLCQGLEQTNHTVCHLERSSCGIGNRCLQYSMAQTRGVCLPTVWTYFQNSEEMQSGQMHTSANCPSMENITVVQQSDSNDLRPPCVTPTVLEPSSGQVSHLPSPPCVGKPVPCRLDSVREHLQSEGISARAAEIIHHKQKPSTRRAYDLAWQRWVLWNNKRNSNPFSPHIPNILEFLIDLFDTGIQVGSLGIYRAALSSALPLIESAPVGQHRRVSELIDGMTNQRPRQYKSIPNWNVDQVLHTLISWGKIWQLSVTQLTHKLAMLFALSSSARCSELTSLDTKCMVTLPHGIEFRLVKHKKNRRAAILPGTLFIPSTDRKDLCPVYHLNHYLIETHKFRTESGPDLVFRALTPPHHGITPATMSRWLSEVIHRSGYQGSGNIGHSTRSKSTSKSLLFPGFTIRQIMDHAEWKSESVFKQFYHDNTHDAKIGQAVLHLDDPLESKG